MENSEFKLPSDEPEQLLVKSQENSDPNYGYEPKKRNIKDLLRYGVINLDKPAGPSSHEVTAWVKRILNLKRAGHGGTLET